MNWLIAIIWIGLLLGYLGFHYAIEELKQQIACLQHGYYENSDAIDDLYERVFSDDDICPDCMVEDWESFIKSELPVIDVTPKKKAVKKTSKKVLTKKTN